MSHPEWIGPYRIIEEIARGGMAIVYRAIDSRNQRIVALKVLPPYFAHDPAFIKRFQKEGANAARLKHPNIVQTFEVGEDHGRHYIAMEFVQGKTLAQLLDKTPGPMDVTEAIEILRQIASGLSYAHQRGVVHRDIKPSNIIIAADSGKVMIMDFGIAKQMAKEETMVTVPGTTVGTPAYMSPEQVRGDANLGPESDVYSLGVLAYLMFSGRLPFPAENPILLMNQILNEPPQSFSEVRPDIPLGIAYAVMKALAKEPKYRYPNAVEFVKALKKGLYWAPSQREYRGVLDHTKSADQRLTPTQSYEQQRFESVSSGKKWIVFVFLGLLFVGIGISFMILPWRQRLIALTNLRSPETAAVAANPSPSPVLPTHTPMPSPTLTPTATPTRPPTQVPTHTTLPPQQSGQTILIPYESADSAYKLLIPADWTYSNVGDDVIFISEDGFKRVQIRHLTNLPLGKDIDQLLDELLQEAKSAFQQIETGERTRSEKDGVILVRQAITAEVLGAQFFGEILAVKKDQNAFLILAAAPLSDEPVYKQVFNTILGSFRLNPEQLAHNAPATSSPTRNPTPTLAPTRTKAKPTSTPRSRPLGTPTPQVVRRADPNLILDFENESRWIIGDQKYGYAIASDEKVATGKRSLKIGYEDLPGVQVEGEHFIVLMRPRPAPIPGKPQVLQAKVFGNADNVFLNLWLKDAKGEVWQFTFGQVAHTGWKTMYLPIDPQGEWPVDIIRHRGNETIDYPLQLLGLVVDNAKDETITGTIYIDDLRTAAIDKASVAKNATPEASSSPTEAQKTPASSEKSAGPEVALVGRIAYSIWNPGLRDYQIQLVNADGSNPHTYYVGATQPDFCLRPAGRMVADGTKPGLEGVMVIENGQGREVFPNTTDTLPACSPEGQRVVFESRREGGPHIWIHPDINLHDDLASYRFTFGEYPSWSSKWQIVWKGCDYWAGSGGNCGIWQAPDGWGAPVRLSSDASDTAPDVSPDGQKVVFMSHKAGKWQIYIVPAYGGQPQQVTTEGDNGLPTWSPDGRSIAFVSNRDGGWGLWAMNQDGSNQRKIMTLEAGFGAGPVDWTLQRISWGP